ncbi:hypothetical protein J7I08_004202 [Vibrio vulnificus]|nr:hypothetical protein [Vibrio vulnificus]
MRFALHFISCMSAVLILLLSSFMSHAQERYCEIGNSSARKKWDGRRYGDNPNLCVRGCEYRVSSVGTTIPVMCFPSSSDSACYGSFISTGGQCNSDGFFFGGKVPDQTPDPKPEPSPDSNPNSAMLHKWDQERASYSCAPANDGKFSCSGLHRVLAKLDTAINDDFSLQTYELKQELDKISQEVVDNVIGANEANQKAIEKVTQAVEMASMHTNFQISRIGSDVNTQLTPLLDRKFDNLDSTLTFNQNELRGNQNTLQYLVTDMKRGMHDKFSNVFRSLSNNEITMNNGFSEVLGKLDSLSSDTGNQDGVIGAVNAVGSKIDGLGTSLGNIGDQLGDMSDLLGGKGLNKGEHDSLVKFNELPLYQESDITKLNTEVEELKNQYNQKVQDFKSLFAFNASSLTNGEFVEHTLNFSFANGGNLSASSSVFPALVRNSGTISAVILFIAVIAGLRVVMGAKD